MSQIKLLEGVDLHSWVQISEANPGAMAADLGSDHWTPYGLPEILQSFKQHKLTKERNILTATNCGFYHTKEIRLD